MQQHASWPAWYTPGEGRALALAAAWSSAWLESGDDVLHCALEGALVGRLLSRYIGGKVGRQGQVGRATTNTLLHEPISNVRPIQSQLIHYLFRLN